MRVVAISGSLRSASSNLAILLAIEELAVDSMNVEIFSGLADIPAFNPDLVEREPSQVSVFRRLLREADAVIISSPEYIHGVPGALKNALDWLAGGVDLAEKPVLLISSAERATYLRESLADMLRTIGARLAFDGAMVVPLPTNRMNAEEILANPSLSMVLRKGLGELSTMAKVPL